MRILEQLILIGLALSESTEDSKNESRAAQRLIKEVYPDDPKAAFRGTWKSSNYKIQANKKFREKLQLVNVKSNFVNKMLNINNVVPLTPVSAFQIMDDVPYCWIILCYDSNSEHHPAAMVNLTAGLSEYFHQRCAIGSLDMSYPSNHDTFHNIVTSTPSILVKYAETIHTMFHHGEITPSMPYFKPTPISEWGHFFSNHRLEYDTFGVIKELNHVYDFQSNNVKMMALAMSHYLPKYYHPAGKMIADIVNDLHEKVVEIGMEKGIYPSPFYGKHNLTEEEQLQNDEKYYHWIKNSLSKTLEAIDIEKQVHLHINGVANFTEEQLKKMTQPSPRRNILELISYWVNVHMDKLSKHEL